VSYRIPLLGIHLKLSVFCAGCVILTYYMFEHLIMLPCLLELQILLALLKLFCNYLQRDIHVRWYKNVKVISLSVRNALGL